MMTARTDFSRRARSSRRWSDRAIRPSSPTGWTGLPTKSLATPTIDMGAGVPPGSAGGRTDVGLGRHRHLVGHRRGRRGVLGGGRGDLGGRGRLGGGLGVVVVVAKTLGLVLE